MSDIIVGSDFKRANNENGTRIAFAVKPEYSGTIEYSDYMDAKHFGLPEHDRLHVMLHFQGEDKPTHYLIDGYVRPDQQHLIDDSVFDIIGSFNVNTDTLGLASQPPAKRPEHENLHYVKDLNAAINAYNQRYGGHDIAPAP